MKKPLTALILVSSASLLSACFHSPAVQPESYCHQLKTQINSFPASNIGTPGVNAANRAALVQRYNQVDCEDQP